MPEAKNDQEYQHEFEQYMGCMDLEDDDVAYALDLKLQLNVDGEPAEQGKSAGKSLGDHIAAFAGGDTKLEEQILDNASGITSAASTKKTDSWARRKYEFVQKHRLPALPASPWK